MKKKDASPWRTFILDSLSKMSPPIATFRIQPAYPRHLQCHPKRHLKAQGWKIGNLLQIKSS
jgi:hypothetical protein